MNSITNQTKWSVDQAHSEISFKVKHLMIANVKGSFKIFDANIYTEAKDFTTAVIDLWIDSSSISTGDEKRDEHLRSADFFDVENHKQITFTSSSMASPDSNGKVELWGEFTMRGITRNIKLDCEFGGITLDPWGNEKAGFSIAGIIKRSDWGLSWNSFLESGGFMVSDEVTISCDIELLNQGVRDFSKEIACEPYEEIVI
jgi:polyisoprenoid-binding protein YceI